MLPIFVAGSLCVAFAGTVPELLVLCSLQAFCGGGRMSVGAGVISNRKSVAMQWVSLP